MLKKLQNKSQCGNFRRFLSLIFYVKSILRKLEVKKTAILALLEALNFDCVDFFSIFEG